MIKIFSYNSRGNNATGVETENGKFYFSYNTLVGFTDKRTWETFVRQNVWGTTTGLHLNDIDTGSKQAKENRVDKETFVAEYEKRFGKYDD